MKNYEKYKDKINNHNGEYFCHDFVKPIILKVDECDARCSRCRLLQAIWLNEEYEEPEVDWSKVAVDTPIFVRDSAVDNWKKRHFADYDNGRVYTYKLGTTSWTAENQDDIICWNYAKLAKQEYRDE